MKRLRSCTKCHTYTMKEEHCGEKTESAHPAKFSPEDRWGRYRKKAREAS